MPELRIKNIEELMAPILVPNRKYIGEKIAKLTSAGDNYGSLMLGVTVITEDDKGQTDHANVVAKLLPENEFVQALFNAQRTFRNEVGFYQNIAPCLRDFQQEQGLSELFGSFPDFYGARISLNPSSNKVDCDGVLLIKNIKDEGFTNVDRTVGFDLEQSRLVLVKLAELHATFLAFKTLKPEVFDRKLGQHFEQYTVFDSADESSGEKMINSILEPLKDDEFCALHMEKIKNTLIINSKNIIKKNYEEIYKSAFPSFVHSDMWTNNIMVKIISGKITDVKFIDFQIYECSSLTRDVVFFLFTSVQFPVIRQHCDDLLRFYYDNFITYLKKLKCDTSPFSFEGFIEEMKIILQKLEFFHIMLMLAPIYASDKNTKEVEDIDEDDLIDQRMQVDEICKQKAYFIVKELIKRAWI